VKAPEGAESPRCISYSVNVDTMELGADTDTAVCMEADEGGSASCSPPTVPVWWKRKNPGAKVPRFPDPALADLTCSSGTLYVQHNASGGAYACSEVTQVALTAYPTPEPTPFPTNEPPPDPGTQQPTPEPTAYPTPYPTTTEQLRQFAESLQPNETEQLETTQYASLPPWNLFPEDKQEFFCDTNFLPKCVLTDLNMTVSGLELEGVTMLVDEVQVWFDRAFTYRHVIDEMKGAVLFRGPMEPILGKNITVDVETPHDVYIVIDEPYNDAGLLLPLNLDPEWETISTHRMPRMMWSDEFPGMARSLEGNCSVHVKRGCVGKTSLHPQGWRKHHLVGSIAVKSRGLEQGVTVP